MSILNLASVARRKWQRLRHQMHLVRRWWLYPHRPFTPLFILATYRSGSNLLLDYVNCLPGVRCLPEVLCPALAIGLPESADRPKKALPHIRYSLQALKAPIRGCKLMLDQLAICRLPPEGLDAAFPGAKYVVLYRRSLAEQFLSHKTAQATRQYVLHAGQDPKAVQVLIDPAELSRYCQDTRQAYQQALSHAWLGGRAALLSYEDLTADPQHCLREQICPLLGVPYTDAKTSLRKQSTLPIADRVQNYFEVATLLASPLCSQDYSFLQPTTTHGKAA